MKRVGLILPGVIILVLVWSCCSYASSFGMMRSSSRAVRSGISKNLELTFRPRLNFEKVKAGPVSLLALSGDETLLVSVVGDRSLRLWDLAMGKEIGVVNTAGDRIQSLAISTDSKFCYYLDQKGKLYSLNLNSLGIEECAYCPEANQVTALDDGGLALAGRDGELVIVDPRHRSVLDVIDLEARSLYRIKASSTQVVAASSRKIYRISPGQPLEVLKAKSSAVTLGENFLAFGTAGGDIYLKKSGSPEVPLKIYDGKKEVSGLDIDEAGQVLVFGDKRGEVGVVDLRTGQSQVLGSHGDSARFVRIDNEGRHVLTASDDGTIKLWSLVSKRLLLTLISAKNGWAIVDDKGRFDGSLAALEGITWEDGKHAVQIEGFSERYYEPNLLPRTLDDPDGLSQVAAIEDGVGMYPEVEIVKTRGGEEHAIVKVVGNEAGKGGLRDVMLFNNGKRVSESHLVKSEVKEEKDSKTVYKEYSLDLAKGENLLAAVAVNEEDLESPPKELRLKNGRPAADRTLWMVTVGVNKYHLEALHLDYARPDAESVSSFFEKNAKVPVEKKALIRLYDEDATRSNILKVFKALREVPREDLVVVYLAGHGVNLGDGWFFLPQDVQEASEERVREDGISTEELKLNIEEVGADRMVLFIDACQSGGAVSPIKNFSGIKSLRMLARQSGVHILSATDKDQFAVELASLGHGVFTYTLLEALNQKGTSGKGLSVMDVLKYVEEKVPAMSKKYADYVQFPVSHSRGYDFILENH